MGARQAPLRVVLDTNVLVSSLVFAGRLGWLREAWTKGRLRPLVDRRTADELLRVLAYPKLALEPEEIEALLADVLPYAEVVPVSSPVTVSLRCADPDDQKFLDLALAGGADALVTGDRHLLALAGQAPFRIVPPAALRDELG